METSSDIKIFKCPECGKKTRAYAYSCHTICEHCKKWVADCRECEFAKHPEGNQYCSECKEETNMLTNNKLYSNAMLDIIATECTMCSGSPKAFEIECFSKECLDQIENHANN